VTITTSELDCGIRLVTERMPGVHSVTAGFWVGIGSRDEVGSLAGASHFLEHLLFKGTPTRTAEEISEAIDAVGGDLNAFTTKEYTAFYVRLLADEAELGYDILSDIMWDPAFRPEEVESERQVILEEILMHADEPADLVHEAFGGALFPDHPLGREVLGEKATIEAMPREAIASFHADHYRPANIVMAAAGAIEHEEVAAAIDRRFRGGPGGSPPRRSPPDHPARRLHVVRRPTEQAHLVVGVPAIHRDDDDRFALGVLNHVLGGGISSRLFQEIREKRGLAYSVYSYRSGFQDAGELGVYAGTAPAHVHQVLDLVDVELDRLSESGITARELEVAKGHLVGTLVLGLEDSASRMSRIGRSLLVHGEVLTVQEVNAQVEAVSLDDVARVAARVLSGQRVLAVVGPFRDDDFAARVA
jgi:predicted Zn-dependent peptidase